MPSGEKMMVELALMDSGDQTDAVYVLVLEEQGPDLQHVRRRCRVHLTVQVMVGRVGALTRADLAMLKSMRDDLEAQLANEESGSLLGRTYVAFFTSQSR